MARDTVIYSCGCGAKIHINFVTRKVTLVERSGGKKPQGLDELVEAQGKDAAKRDEKFLDALEKTETEKDRLDAMFEDAKKKVAKEKDTKPPPNPFDME